MLRFFSLLLLPFLLLLAACRGEEEQLIAIETEPIAAPRPHARVGAMVLLCEGNMGSNKASLDYMDFRTGHYHRNIYGALNPGVVMALGDVGNDVLLHGSRLYVVVNASGLIEVLHAGNGRHIGSITLPNCRQLAARGGKVYATSFASPIGFSPSEQRGEVVEIDTLTLAIGRRCTVGEQPEGLTLTGQHLLVANSGGYRAPDYARSVSVLSLSTFRVERTLEVGLNPQHLLTAPDGLVYVASRGNYADIAPSVQCINPAKWQVSQPLGFVATSWWLDDARIYALGTHYDKATGQYSRSLVCYDTRSQRIVQAQGENLRGKKKNLRGPQDFLRGSQDFLGGKKNVLSGKKENFAPSALETLSPIVDETVFAALRMPYGIAVNPETKEIYLADAGNFTSPGTLHCFAPTGQHRWQSTTGDIPGHFAFLPSSLGTPNFSSSATPPTTGSAYITRVLSYRPAPGQHTNTLPEASEQDSEATMCRKVLETIGHNRRGLVGLGGWGGQLVVGFDHRIARRPQGAELHIDGNAFEGSAEPGLVEVAVDRNQNGQPDENEWYRLLAPNSSVQLMPYQLTYLRPKSPKDQPVIWRDAQGETGTMERNLWHTQPYFPLWFKGEALSFTAWRLPNTAVNKGNAEAPLWVLPRVDGAWADNSPRGDDFDLDWAVDAQGRRVSLAGIDFVRITTALHQSAGWLGESSTDVSNVYELP